MAIVHVAIDVIAYCMSTANIFLRLRLLIQFFGILHSSYSYRYNVKIFPIRFYCLISMSLIYTFWGM